MKNIKERIKNWWKKHLANVVTVIGLITSFLFLRSVLIEAENILKITIYAFISGITDFIDGPMARWLKSESVAGSYLDRIRDRIFIYPGIIILGYQYKEEIPFFELLVSLLIALALLEVLIFRIGVIALYWYLRGKDIDIRPNKDGKKKIFAGFSIIFVWVISLNLSYIGISILKYSIWIIYLGLVLMIFWSLVSLKEYMKEEEQLRREDAKGKLPLRKSKAQ